MESTRSSGFFFKKKPPCTPLDSARALENRSRACSHYQGGGAGSQFFSNQGVRSDAYRVSASDDRRRVGKNWPRTFEFHPCDEDLSPWPWGCGRKSGQTKPSPRAVRSTVEGENEVWPDFHRNAIQSDSVNRPVGLVFEVRGIRLRRTYLSPGAAPSPLDQT